MLKKCPSCNREFEAKNGKKYCSQICKPAASGVKNGFRLFHRDGFRCIYCGASSIEDKVKLSLDHVVPYSKGGVDEAWNVATCCVGCNGQKYSRSLSDESLSRILVELARRNELFAIRPNEEVRGIGEAQRGRARETINEKSPVTQAAPFPLRLPDELRTVLEEIAEAEMRSLNAVIVRALTDYITRVRV